MKFLQTVRSGALRLRNIKLARHALVLLSMSLAFVSPLAMVQTATAQAACWSNSICFWQDINYSGTQVGFSVPPANTCIPMVNGAFSFDNRASSLVSNLNYGSIVYFYDTNNCTGGGAGWITTSAQGGFVPWVGSALNDRISSFKIF